MLTIVTTTLSGAEWIYGSSFLSGAMNFSKFKEGFWFSIPFLTFLTFHEFGHYFMAKIRKVRVTLPYYLPGWLGIIMTIGTFGAFIKIKDFITQKRDYFDIGIAGPLAGLVVSVVTLIIGFKTLPGDEFIYKIHPEYYKHSGNYREILDNVDNQFEAVVLGKPLLYQFLEKQFANPDLIPHPYELSHYPLLLAGLLGLLFTAINLLPIGQLDGGHILFSMIGQKRFNIFSPIALVVLVFYSGLGMYSFDFLKSLTKVNETGAILEFLLYVVFLYLCFSKIFKKTSSNWILALSVLLIQLLATYFFPGIHGYSGLLLFGFLLGRVLGVYHPPTFDRVPLGMTRFVLGIVSMIIFVLCFSPNPIQ